MFKFFETVTEPLNQNEILRRHSYGVIEVEKGDLSAIHLRPFPKLISSWEAKWAAEKKKSTLSNGGRDRIQLFYNQPMFHRNFLALKYFVSDSRCSIATIAVSLSVLDYVAMVKGTDAIVTDITNDRIKDRHLEHFGWEKHLENCPRRNWIKRFYGEYPESFLFEVSADGHCNSKDSEQLSPEAIKPTGLSIFPQVDLAAHPESHQDFQ